MQSQDNPGLSFCKDGHFLSCSALVKMSSPAGRFQMLNYDFSTPGTEGGGLTGQKEGLARKLGLCPPAGGGDKTAVEENLTRPA